MEIRNKEKHRYSTAEYNIEYELTKTKRWLVTPGGQSTIAKCRTKISSPFSGVFGIFAVRQNFLIIYSTIFRGVQNGFWETPVVKHWLKVCDSGDAVSVVTVSVFSRTVNTASLF